MEFEPCGTWWEIPRWRRVFRWMRWMPIGYITSVIKLPFCFGLIKEEGWDITWIFLISEYERKLDRYWRFKKWEKV